MENQEQKIEELLTRGVAEVIDREHIKARLLKGDTLRVKLGIDPTSPHIHLGRSVPLLKLRDFQDLGHQVVFIVGDYTGQIGDTSDKDSERPMLTEAIVKQNMEHYLAQAGRVLDGSKVEVHYNSEWLSELSFQRIGALADAFSLAEFIARENIKKRLEEGKRISLREILYPLMQGYDSVMVQADVELGGTDQRFNLLAGRTLQRALSQGPQDILTTNLILGTDGRKMSSSWGNTINLTDVPNDMFGKIMSIPDELIESYLIHCTRLPLIEVKALLALPNPRDAKLRLAEEIVKIYHGQGEATQATEYFVQTFSKGQLPENIPEHRVRRSEELGTHESILDYIIGAGFAASRGEARRKIEQGGVSIDGVSTVEARVLNPETDDKKVLRVGKKDFVRIVF